VVVAAPLLAGADARAQHGDAPPARVHGVVYDSVARAPLAGAVVQLMQLGPGPERAARRVARSDSAGVYGVDSVPPGPFAITFFHPKLDSLGIEAPVRRGRTGGPREQTIDLAVPSPRTVVSSACGRRAARDSSGFVAGYVREPVRNRPLAHARVRVRWRELVIDARGARATAREETAFAGEGGWFGLCGVPPGTVLLARVVTPRDSGSAVELEVPETGILLRPLYHLAAEAALTSTGVGAAGRDAAPPPAHGRSLVSGEIRGEDGAPLGAARVRIWGRGRETVTNEDGRFTLEVPPGSHTLEARAMGYVPLHLAIDVIPGAPARHDLTMQDVATVVDTVRVLGRRSRDGASPGGFEYRRSRGYGTFLDADEIERRAPAQFSDLLRTVNGVLVGEAAGGNGVHMFGSGKNDRCEPLVVIDGMTVPLESMHIDELIPAHVVRAVEVYPRRLEAPPEYQSFECGTIVVWTGTRGWLARRGRPN
jgi:hypothetical protein